MTTVSRLEVRGRVFDLDVYGGVIATRADNEAINTILDLKDKIIGAGSTSFVNAAQTQFYEMVKAGMSYVMDPKQVVFTHNQDEVVDGILSGEFDVGECSTVPVDFLGVTVYFECLRRCCSSPFCFGLVF